MSPWTKGEKLGIITVLLAALIGIGIMLYSMGIVDFKQSDITGAATGTNLPPEYTLSSTKFVTDQKTSVLLNLGDVFKDPEGAQLTYVTTKTEGVIIDIKDNTLTITPEPGFTGTRVVTIFASDGEQITRKRLSIDVIDKYAAASEPEQPAAKPPAPAPEPETPPAQPETPPSEPQAPSQDNETQPTAPETPAIQPPTITTKELRQDIPKIEREVETKLETEDEITAIIYFNESAVNEAGLIVAQDSKDPRENWLAIRRAKVKAARELMLANVTPSGFTTSELGFKVIRQYDTINAIAVKLTKSGIAKLNNSPNVISVFSEKILHTMLNQSVPMINAEDLWNQTYNNTMLDGRGVAVCIVDTGIDFNHSAFVNNNSKIFGGYDYVNEDNSPQDDNGHGTHCAGIVGGNMTGIMGVSPNIRIVPVKVCNAGGSCPDIAILAGIDYCINNSAVFNIATISGSLGSGATYNSANCLPDADAAFLIALAAGVTPVFAAGNWGSRPGVSWPACSQYAISVGNVNKTDVISVSSNYGGDRFDVWAPGSNIYSAALGGGAVEMSGTSMATPHMAAIIAMIQHNQRLQNRSILNITQMHEFLNSTGIVVSSWRRTDVYAAILKLNANLTMNQSDNSITNVTANTTLKFKNTTNFEGFIQCGAISYNYVSIDSSLCPDLNRSAHITFGNLSFVNATPTRNGGKCPAAICQNATYANGTLDFDVTEFSSYSSTEGNVFMELTKTDSQDPINASSPLNYTILINVTRGNAGNITLTELYPAELIYLSAQPSPLAGTNNTFIVGNLTENQTFIVNISMFVTNSSNGTLINNTVNVTFQNDTSIWINMTVNESTLLLNPPIWNFTNLNVFKNSSAINANASDYFNYTINVTVSGNASFAFDVTVNDTYPSQIIYQDSQPAPVAGTNNTWILGNLSPGTTILVNISTFVRNISNGTMLNNTVNVTCINDTNEVISFVSYKDNLVLSPYNTTNVSMLKVHSPNIINSSSSFNYTITFTNTGSAVIYNLLINDTYPIDLTYIDAEPAPDPGTNNSWTLGTFVLNAKISINISMSVPGISNGIELNNSANATYQTDMGELRSVVAQDSSVVNNPPTSCPVTINTSTTLSQNLTSATTCITVNGSNLVLDCDGRQITYNTGEGSLDNGIIAVGKTNITIQNCIIRDNSTGGSYNTGINFTNVSSSFIRNTVINSTGSSTNAGITIMGRTLNVTVTNVTILTKGSSSTNYGVYLYNASNNIIANSTIIVNSTSGSDVYGVIIDDYSHNNTIDNSTITADGTSNYNTGVHLRYTVSNNIVSGNTIKALSTATLAYAVYLNSNNNQMSQNKVINNNIRVNCSSSCYGIYVNTASTYGTIENNTVNSAGRGNGNTNYGIFLYNGPGNYAVKNNTVRTYGIGELNHGIYIWGNVNVNNNSVINNNIFPSGTSKANIGIWLIGASTTVVTDNNISTYGTQENHGIYVSSGSAGCTVANNTILANGSAGYNYGLLAVTGGDNSTFADNNITVIGVDSTGIYSSSSQGNSFLNNKINTSGSDGLLVLGDNIVYFSTNSIDTTNTINGTPIYYYGGAGSSPACPNNQELSSPSSPHIDFIGCNNITLSSYAGSEGILLANTANSTINYTVIRDTMYPVRLLFNSSYNNITYSNLTSNHSSGGYGVWIGYSAANNTVSASNITTIGLATDNNYGVYINNSNNNIITGSSISTNGSKYNYGVFLTLYADDNTISNNRIKTRGAGQENKGVYIYSYASENAIINNTIITNGTTYDDGIQVYSYSDNNRLENNTINADGSDYVYGINVQLYSKNTTVKGNNITIYTQTTNIQYANGIFLQSTVTGTIADNNNILMSSYAMFNVDTNHGIYLTNAHNNTITNNYVNTSGIYDYHLGIYLSSYSSNNLIENNTVITGGRNYNHGIMINGQYDYSPCNNNTIKNNTVLVNGTAGINYGIYQYQYINKNDVLGNRIVTNCTYSCEGIRFYTSGSNAMIANNTIIASGSPGATSNYGIYMYSGSNNNVIADNSITTTGAGSHGIYLVGSSNETLHNNNITIQSAAQGLYIDTDATTPDISQFLHTIDTQNTINGTPIYYYGGLDDSPACPNNQVLSSPNTPHLDLIGCNNVTLNGFTAFEPVTIVNATNSTVNNSRILNAYAGIRLFFNSAHNTISSCNLTTENLTSSNYGILIYHGANNNTVDKNNVSATSAGAGSDYGIHVYNSSSQNNITNNFIFANSTTNNYGVYIQKSSSRNLVDSNNIRAKASSSVNYGVYIYQSSEGNIIRNNTIRTNLSTGSQGVVLDNYASNNTVTGCTILEWNTYGLYVANNAHNNTVSYNYILSNDSSSASKYGIYLATTLSETKIVGNNITNNGSQNCWGIYLYSNVQKGIIANNTIRTQGTNSNNHGIYLYSGCTNNTISGNRINAMGRGIYLYSLSEPSWFNENNITAIGDYAIYLQSATGSLFNRTIFENSTYWLYSDASSMNNFTNTTFGSAFGGITILPLIQLNTTTLLWSQINSSFNKTYINSTNLTFFNTTGLVTITNLTGSIATARVDYDDDGVYEDCPSTDCVQQSFSGGTFVFNVTHFTSYAGYASEEAPISNVSNLTITKTDSPDPVTASTNLTYQINISVAGNGTAYNVTVNETYPNEIIYLASQPDPVAGKNNSWILGNLSQGTNISINITVLVLNITNGSIINNTANATFQNESGTLLDVYDNESTTVNNPPVINDTNITSCPVTINASINLTQDLITFTNDSCIIMNSSNITLDCAGHTILYATNGTNQTYGIFAYLQDNLTVKNCVIMSVNSTLSYSAGINFTNVTNILIQNNTIVTNGTRDNHGFFSLRSANVTVINNTIRVGRTHENYGIAAVTSDKGLIANNTVVSCCGNTAVGIFGQTNFTIINNAVNVTGVSSSSGITTGNENIIENNTVEVHGQNVNSVINFANGNTVKNNTMYINGTSDNLGINGNGAVGKGNIIVLNNITVIGTSYCLAISADAYNTIENNTARLFASSSDNKGVYVNANNTIRNNTIRMNGTDSNEMIRERGDTIITGNNITLFSATHDNAIIYAYPGTVMQYNNFILNGSGSTNTGLDISLNDNFPAVIGNNISVSGSDTIAGIYLSGQTNVTVAGNNVTVTATDVDSYGIRFDDAVDSATVDNNTISVSGNGLAYGIVVNGALTGANNITNNSITVSGTVGDEVGIGLIVDADTITGQNVINNVVNVTASGGSGIFLGNASVNILTGNNVTSQSGYSVFVSGGGNNSFANTTLNNPDKWLFVAADSNGNNFTRTLFAQPAGIILIIPTVLLENNTNATKAKLNITNNKAFLNSSNLSSLNVSAQITLNSITYANPLPTVDYEDDGSYIDCPSSQCTELSYAGNTFVYNTTHFTGYSSEETPLSNMSNLSLSKTDSPDPVNVSTNLTYQINVSVTGNGTAYNTTVNDTYPNEIIYLTSSPTPFAGTNNTWILGNLTQGTNISINITVLVLNITGGSTINNTANATFQNESSNNLRAAVTAQTLVLAPSVALTNFTNMSIRKTDNPDPVNSSRNLTYQINVSSTGNGTAYNVTVNDTYPNEVIYITAVPVPTAGNNSWNLGNLAAGINRSINITVLVRNITNGSTINNTANVTFQNETSAFLTYGAFAETTVLNPPVINTSIITIAKTGTPNPITPGATLTYTITVTSSGTGTAHNVTLNDTYPAETIFNTAQPTPVAGTNNSFVLGNLTSGTVVVLNITVNVSAATPNGIVINNTANASYNNETGALLTAAGSASTTVTNATPSPTPGPQPGGSSGGGGGGVGRPINRTQPVQPPQCVENWACEAWTECRDFTQTRECVDLNACGSDKYSPATARSCTAQPAKEAQVESPGQPRVVGSISDMLSESVGAPAPGIGKVIVTKAKDILNVALWPMIFIVLAIILTIGGFWAVSLRRRDDEDGGTTPAMPAEPEELAPELPAQEEPEEAEPEPVKPQQKPRMPEPLQMPRAAKPLDKKFYSKFDSKLSSINRQLAKLDNTNKKLGKKLGNK